jgi:hypothetical protein
MSVYPRRIAVTTIPPEMNVVIQKMDNDSTLPPVKDRQNSPSPLPDPSLIEHEFLKWQELELYFKFVACHASNLSHLLCERAHRMVHLQQKCDYFGWRMRNFSRKSLATYQMIRAQLRVVGSIQERKTDGSRCTIACAVHLRECITGLRTFDSLCLAVPHQPGMDQIAWSMVQYENTSRNVITGAGDMPLLDLIKSAERCIQSAMNLVSEAVGTHWGNKLRNFCPV